MDFSRPNTARRINTLKVLSVLRKSPVSRADLSRILGINKISVGEIVDSLIKYGLAVEGTKTETGSAGRPSLPVSINPSYAKILALVNKQRTVSIAFYNAAEKVLRFERVPKSEGYTDRIYELIDKVGSDSKILGCVVVSREDYDELSPNFPVFTVPPSVAEAENEISKSSETIPPTLFLSWSDSFDASFYDGTLRHIPTFPHIRVSNSGSCSCGGIGCLEAAASGDILKKAGGTATYKELFRSGGIPESALIGVAMALSQGTQALGAERAVITGEMSAMPEEAFNQIGEYLSQLLPPSGRKSFRFEKSESGESGAADGAAVIALDRFLYRTGLLSKLSELESYDD